MKKKIIVIACFFIIFNYSHAQKNIYWIEILPISEIDSIKQDSIKRTCDFITYTYYPRFTLYTCSPESNYFYTSRLRDTLTVHYLVFIRFHFTDTLSYFLIDSIKRYSDDKVVFSKKRELKLVKKIIFQKEKKSVKYYEGQTDEIHQRFIIPFTFVPTKSKAKRVMSHNVIFL